MVQIHAWNSSPIRGLFCVLWFSVKIGRAYALLIFFNNTNNKDAIVRSIVFLLDKDYESFTTYSSDAGCGFFYEQLKIFCMLCF